MKKLTKAAKAQKTARFRATMQARKDAKLNIQASNASHQTATHIKDDSIRQVLGEEPLVILLAPDGIVVALAGIRLVLNLDDAKTLFNCLQPLFPNV